jgi:hypothetical protein
LLVPQHDVLDRGVAGAGGGNDARDAGELRDAGGDDGGRSTLSGERQGDCREGGNEREAKDQ